MSDCFAAYCRLINSPEQLALCRQAQSVQALLALIKSLWQKCDLSDDQLLRELSELNQQIITDASVQLAGQWMPYRYKSSSRSIYWCLADGPATEPFQDEYISRCRQQILLNQLLSPQTALSALRPSISPSSALPPAVFIFHLSRCGSTLLSTCLAQLDKTFVLSEPPVITEMLLDANLSRGEKQLYLRLLVQAHVDMVAGRNQLIIKWNAWDIFSWSLLREIYPQLPVVFLGRNPIEILASHQRLAGRHMAGDPQMRVCHRVFAPLAQEQSLLAWRIAVLRELMLAMELGCAAESVYLVDYQHLQLNQIIHLLGCIGLPPNAIEQARIKRRMLHNAKAPEQTFSADLQRKHTLFSRAECASISAQLMPLYRRLFSGELVDQPLNKEVAAAKLLYPLIL